MLVDLIVDHCTSPPMFLIDVWQPTPKERYDKQMYKMHYADRKDAENCQRYLGLWFDWFRGGPECMRTRLGD